MKQSTSQGGSECDFHSKGMEMDPNYCFDNRPPSRVCDKATHMTLGVAGALVHRGSEPRRTWGTTR